MMIKRILLFLLISIAIVCAGAITIYFVNPFDVKTDNIRPRLFGFDIYRIPSKSMQPALQPGDYITVSNIAYHEKSPSSGDVIVFYRPKPNKNQVNVPFIKRVLAVGGDSILLQNGELFVNKKLVKQDYVLLANRKTPYSLTMKKIIVPNDHVFVLGDNRDNSADSRMFGPVSQTAIIGKASSILFGADDRNGIEIK